MQRYISFSSILNNITEHISKKTEVDMSQSGELQDKAGKYDHL